MHKLVHIKFSTLAAGLSHVMFQFSLIKLIYN